MYIAIGFDADIIVFRTIYFVIQITLQILLQLHIKVIKIKHLVSPFHHKLFYCITRNTIRLSIYSIDEMKIVWEKLLLRTTNFYLCLTFICGVCYACITRGENVCVKYLFNANVISCAQTTTSPK